MTSDRLDEIPFSTLTLGADGRVLSYSMFAKSVFPELRRGISAETHGIDASRLGFYSARVFGEICDLYAVKEEGAVRIVFLSGPGFPLNGILRKILEESDFAMRKFDAALKTYLKSEREGAPFGKMLCREYDAARFVRLHQAAALEFLRAGEIVKETPQTVLPGAFLGRMAARLEPLGYGLPVHPAPAVPARLPLGAFARAVLDLVIFPDLFRDLRLSFVSVTSDGGKVRIRFSYEDRCGFSDAFRSFLASCPDGAALFLPLLSAMTICRRAGIAFHVVPEDGRVTAVFEAPGITAGPELFLGVDKKLFDSVLDPVFHSFAFGK